MPTTHADYIRRLMRSSETEGARDRVLERRILTYGDDMKVELYAGDVRTALAEARLWGLPSELPAKPFTIRRATILVLMAIAHRIFHQR